MNNQNNYKNTTNKFEYNSSNRLRIFSLVFCICLLPLGYLTSADASIYQKDFIKLWAIACFLATPIFLSIAFRGYQTNLYADGTTNKFSVTVHRLFRASAVVVYTRDDIESIGVYCNEMSGNKEIYSSVKIKGGRIFQISPFVSTNEKALKICGEFAQAVGWNSSVDRDIH